MSFGFINTWKDYDFTTIFDVNLTVAKGEFLFNIVVLGFGFKIEN